VKGDLAPRDALAPFGTTDGGGDGTRTHDPLLAKQVLYQLSYAPDLRGATPALGARAAGPITHVAASSDRLVGLGGIEPPTFRLSGGRSNR
jgi:hypothetical protein